MTSQPTRGLTLRAETAVSYCHLCVLSSLLRVCDVRGCTLYEYSFFYFVSVFKSSSHWLIHLFTIVCNTLVICICRNNWAITLRSFASPFRFVYVQLLIKNASLVHFDVSSLFFVTCVYDVRGCTLYEYSFFLVKVAWGVSLDKGQSRISLITYVIKVFIPV